MKARIMLVTGGLGFIGKHFVKRCLDLGFFVTNVDVVNYAADRVIMEEFKTYDRYRHIREDVAKLSHLPECDFLINFAAESHVDNSIADSKKFCVSNILGVQCLLELTRAKSPRDRPLFIQISTDEVYGDIEDGVHSASDPLKPSNPYSAAKASADMLVFGWARTYGVRYNIIRMANNYGQHQYPEKLIPKSCWRLMRGLPALMHGDGSYIRSWLHVEDSVDALLTIIEKGEDGTIYNISGDLHLKNIEVVRKIAALLNVPEDQAMVSEKDRVGQDIRYSMDDSLIRSMGWKPQRDFDTELATIVKDIDFKRFL